MRGTGQIILPDVFDDSGDYLINLTDDLYKEYVHGYLIGEVFGPQRWCGCIMADVDGVHVQIGSFVMMPQQ